MHGRDRQVRRRRRRCRGGDRQAEEDDAEAGDAVPARADRRQKLVALCKSHGCDNIVASRAPQDEGRAAIKHAVEDDARAVVAGVAGAQQGPTDARGELPDFGFIDCDLFPVMASICMVRWKGPARACGPRRGATDPGRQRARLTNGTLSPPRRRGVRLARRFLRRPDRLPGTAG